MVSADLPRPIGCGPAERAYLGCLLHLRGRDAVTALQLVDSDELIDPRHRTVLDAARAVVDQGADPDPVLVLGELRRSGLDTSFLDDKTAGVLLVELAEAAPAVVSVGHYARVIREHAWRRRVEEAGVRLQQIAGSAPLEDLAQAVITELQAATADVQRRARLAVAS
jgi:replicative DNA helicase